MWPCVVRNRSKLAPFMSASDGLLLYIVCLGGLATLLGTPRSAVIVLLVQWCTAYLVGRELGLICGVQFTTDLLAVTGFAVALWAIAEYFLDLHVYENTGQISRALGFWAEIQVRGGVARSEAAFGHAIALGGFLALTIPFAMASSWKTLRIPMIFTIALGAIVTLSRGPIISVLVTVLLSIAFVSGKSVSSTKRWATVLTAGFAMVAGPILLSRFNVASSELDSSTAYRENLWTELPSDVSILGQASNMVTDRLGRSTYSGMVSIDSTPLLIGLDFGWMIILPMVVGVCFLIVRVLLRQGTSADIALIGQIPTLLTVALITQYGAAIWFMVGLALAFSRIQKVERGMQAHRVRNVEGVTSSAQARP